MRYVKVENGEVVWPPYMINEQLDGYLPVFGLDGHKDFGDERYSFLFGVSGDTVMRTTVFEYFFPDEWIPPVGFTG